MNDWTKTLVKSEVVFIRHAESFNNCLYDEVRKVHGTDISEEFLHREASKLHQADCGISSRGETQRECLKQYLQSQDLLGEFTREDLNSWTVVSSPMRRCLITAESVTTGLGKTAIVHPLLFETGGCYQSLGDGSTVVVKSRSASEIEAAHPEFSCLPGMENGWYPSNTVEDFQSFRERARTVVQWIWRCHEKRENLIVVGHGNLLSAIISGLQGGDSLILHHNTGISHLELYTAKDSCRVCVVKSINQTPHLPQPLKTGAETVDDHWIQEFLP